MEKKNQKNQEGITKKLLCQYLGGEGNGYIPVKYKSPKVTHLEAENLRGPIKILQITKAV